MHSHVDPDPGHRLRLASGAWLHAVESGSGPTLVQLGGGTLALHNYTHLRPHLSKRLRIVDIDLPGFGLSTASDAGVSFEALVDAAVEAIQSLDGAPVHLAGISLGGVVAALVAARFPHLVHRVVLGGCLFRSDAAGSLMRATWREAASASGTAAVADLTIAAGFSRGFLETKAGRDAAVWIRSVFGRRNTDAYLATSRLEPVADIEAALRAIRAPTLLIGSELDQVTPLDTGPSGVGLRSASTMIKGSTLVVFRDCGHCYYLERPEDAALLMTAYLHGDPLPSLPGVTLEMDKEGGIGP